MSEKITIQNPIGMNAEALKAYATEIGVDYTEDVVFQDLQKAVFAKNKELKEAETNTNDGTENAGGGNTGGKKTYYYWIKYPVYIDEEQRLGAGLYKVDKKFERLNYVSKSYVIFEDNIPERTLTKIAKERGIIFADNEDINVEELFGKILNEVKYY